MNPSKHLATMILIAALGFGAATQAAPPDDSRPAPAAEAPAGPGEIIHSWALAPAGREDGSTRSEFSYTAAPGTVIEDALTIYNFGTEGLPFRIYATDAYNNDSGGFQLLDGDEVPLDVGSWVTVELDTLVVNPGRQVTIPFTITIPEGATAGDHSGALLASSPTIGRGEQDQGQLVVDRRAGSRIFVRVSGELRPELGVSGLTTDFGQGVNPFAGTATVTYRLENRGNVRLSGTTRVDLSGPLGLGGASTEPAAFDELLPGEEFDVTVELDGVEALGVLRTEVVVDDITEGDGDEIDPVTRSSSQFAPPITLLLVVLIALFGLIVYRAINRHRNPPVEVVEPAADSELQHV